MLVVCVVSQNAMFDDVPNDGPGSAASLRRKNPTYCLKPPFLAEDNTRWETGAGTTVEQGFVRLTPAAPGRQGYLWSRVPVSMTDWEVTFEVKIHSEQQTGGEGMAFWFTSRKMLGPVFGASDYWDGLGVMIDTFNRDTETSAFPWITVIYNDGTQKYTAHDDGKSLSLGGCRSRVRNSEQTFAVRVTYMSSFLHVEIAKSRNQAGVPIFEKCIGDIRIALGVDKFFGLSASTAHTGVGLSVMDNHDVYQFMTYDLSPSNSEELIRKKREEYRKEIEEEHRQMKSYHEISDPEFYRGVTSSLQQMAGQLTQIDNIQIDIETTIGALPQFDENGLVNQRSAFDQVRTKLQEVFAYAVQIQSELGASSSYGNRNSQPAEEILRELTGRQSNIQTELQSMNAVLQNMQKAGAGGADQGQGDVAKLDMAAVQSQVRNEFSDFDSRQQERVENVLQAVRRLGETGGQSQESGGGAGTGTTLLLLTLTICGAVTIGLQVMGEGKFKW